MNEFRSLLFAPGSQRRMMAKAMESDADALVFDLEDAVAASALDDARRAVAEMLREPGGPPRFVRVNHPSTGRMEADLAATVGPHLYGVMLPKAETADEIRHLDALLAREERRVGRPAGSIVLLPLVESCRGIHFCYDMATASARIPGMVFSSGEQGDFMADVDGVWTPDGQAMMYARGRLVCETRAAGHSWPVDGVWMNLDDDAGLRRECELARSLGFQAKMAIHPKQVATINDIFTPSAEDVEHSRRLVTAFRESEAAGVGAFRYEGMLVDKANIVRAERILKRSDALAASDRCR